MVIFIPVFIWSLGQAFDDAQMVLMPLFVLAVGGVPSYWSVLVIKNRMEGFGLTKSAKIHLAKEREYGKRLEEYNQKMENLSGGDYIDASSLAVPDRAVLKEVQQAVDFILSSPLHLSGKILDATRNKVILGDLEWQIAEDLQRATKAHRKLDSIGAPKSDHPQAVASHDHAWKALQESRSKISERIGKIVSYAERVEYAQNLLDDDRRAGDYDEVFIELQVESAKGDQQEAVSIR